MFKVKAKSIIKDGKEVSRVSWMKLNKDYFVQDVLKYRDRESKEIITLFLIGDPDTGNLVWVSWAGVNYVE